MAYYQSLALEEKYAADGKLDPEDAEMDAFLEEQGIYNAKHILVAFENSTGTDETTGYPTYSDAEKAAKKAEAEELLAQIRAADDPAAKFDELMECIQRRRPGRRGQPLLPRWLPGLQRSDGGRV